MVLCGSKLKDPGTAEKVSAHQPFISISPLILSNCYKRQRYSITGDGRHKKQECHLFPSLVGLNNYSQTGILLMTCFNVVYQSHTNAFLKLRTVLPITYVKIPRKKDCFAQLIWNRGYLQQFPAITLIIIHHDQLHMILSMGRGCPSSNI